MNIILGFGNTEKKFRSNVFDEISEIIRNCTKIREDEGGGFTKEEIEEIKTKITQLQKKYKKEYEKEEKKNIGDRKERYGHIDFGYKFAWDYDCIFVAFNFWHINSKHPASPDGIALLEVKETKTFYRNN